MVRPDDGHAPARPAHPLHLGQPGLAAMPRRGGEGRAGDDQVGEIVGQRQLVEEPADHPDPVPVVGCCELPPQDPAQRQRGLHRHHVLPALDELHCQPSRARADLGDPVHVARQPAHDPGMEPLGAGQPVKELRFEPVQQFPGQDHVVVRITVTLPDKPARLVAGEHAQVRGRVPAPQLPARPGRSRREFRTAMPGASGLGGVPGDTPSHRPQPSSCRSPRPGPTAAARREAPAAAAPRMPGPGFPWSGHAP